MNQGGFFEPKGISPTSLTIVIAIHAAALTALALSKTDFVSQEFKRTKVVFIPIPDEPKQVEPPTQVDPQPAQPVRASVPVAQPPIVDLPISGPRIETSPTPTIPTLPPGPTITLDPPPDPVRLDAQFDPRFGDRLQPPYPLSEQRMGAEGRVTLKVLIGTDGRVKAVRQIAAASPAFFEATEKHALRNWRFKPATVDGKPVESWKQMTVRFELTA
jgi:protein TonB